MKLLLFLSLLLSGCAEHAYAKDAPYQCCGETVEKFTQYAEFLSPKIVITEIGEKGQKKEKLTALHIQSYAGIQNGCKPQDEVVFYNLPASILAEFNKYEGKMLVDDNQ